jgi:hypothetical protein
MASAARPKACEVRTLKDLGMGVAAREFRALKDFEAMPPVPDFILDSLNSYSGYPASENFKRQLRSSLNSFDDTALWLGRALYDRQIQGWIIPTRDVTEILLSTNVREHLGGYVNFVRETMQKAANLPIDEAKAQRLFDGNSSYTELSTPDNDDDLLFLVAYMLKGSHQLEDRGIYVLSGFLRELYERHQTKIEREYRALTDVDWIGHREYEYGYNESTFNNDDDDW